MSEADDHDDGDAAKMWCGEDNNNNIEIQINRKNAGVQQPVSHPPAFCLDSNSDWPELNAVLLWTTFSHALRWN
ncbi:hypothetical protein EVAR_74152_1 [Eumeta japonica]|uniref:Uncharacterized protein n=1 Tax=Eumeta variegata TaxID=151549 RepID=A0A4C1SAU7_EUMVA|nr:hypothetical protein EVAR_74152_1 [Eumeta japonica]